MKMSLEKESNWSISALPTIEKRSVNKELQTKRVLINFILILLLRLVENFTKLILLKLDSKVIDLENDNWVFYTRLVLNILFIFNISNGIYNILKPNDEFKDLKLSNEQRNLLGLPIINDITKEPIELQKIEPKTFTNSNLNISLSPKRSGLTNTTINKPPIINNILVSPSNKTPIASPMSSPSPIKIKTPSINKTPIINKSINPLLKNTGVFTPTYIPSPKYYYRMDSPTKTRRI